MKTLHPYGSVREDFVNISPATMLTAPIVMRDTMRDGRLGSDRQWTMDMKQRIHIFTRIIHGASGDNEFGYGTSSRVESV